MLKTIDGFKNLISELPDRPNTMLTAEDLKAYFDSSPEELRVALNDLVNALQSTTAGDSGAENIGSAPITGVSGATVYAQLEDIFNQLQTTSVGQIPDNSITDTKIGKRTVDPNLTPNSDSATLTVLLSNIVTQLNKIIGGNWKNQPHMSLYSAYLHKTNTENPHGVTAAQVGAATPMEVELKVDLGVASAKAYTNQKIKGGKIQRGNFSITAQPGLTATQTLVFPEPFDSIPEVIPVVKNSNNPEFFGKLTVNNATTTSCKVSVRNDASFDATVTIGWIAMD